MNREWGIQVDRIRRGKWVVLAFGLVAAVAGFLVAQASPTTYTGYATLTTGTVSRAPEQDGVLSAGYVDYFDRGDYQAKLKSSAGIPAGVTLRARTAAASPLIYIEATSQSLDEAVSGAASAAKAFRDDLNGQLRAVQDDQIATMRKPIDDALAANTFVSDMSLDLLQDRINQINADTSNKLISLQLDSGATERSPKAWLTTLLALLGGLALGCVVAVASGLLSRRLPTGSEVAAKVGLSPIAEIPSARGKAGQRLRAMRFQQLVNLVYVENAPRVLTVTSTVASGGCLEVARAIAQGRAAQGVRTVLVHADVRASDGVGFGDIIADESVHLGSVLTETAPNLLEIKSGRAIANPSAAITRGRLTSLLARLADEVDCVVFAAPPISEAAEAQVLSCAADAVLLVIDTSASRVSDTAESLRLLDGVNSKLVGTVLITVHASETTSNDIHLSEPTSPLPALAALVAGNGHAEKVLATQNSGNGNGAMASPDQRHGHGDH